MAIGGHSVSFGLEMSLLIYYNFLYIYRIIIKMILYYKPLFRTFFFFIKIQT